MAHYGKDAAFILFVLAAVFFFFPSTGIVLHVVWGMVATGLAAKTLAELPV